MCHAKYVSDNLTMVITGCFGAQISRPAKYMHEASPCLPHFRKQTLIRSIVGDMQPDLPLLWGFVHDAGDFVGGYHRSGDHLAAYESCRLSVHLPSSIHLITHHPNHSYVNARTPDEHLYDEYAQMCR